MPPILFPPSTSPGKDSQEGGGRLINAYAEKLSEGAAAQYIIRRAPGLKIFCETSGSVFRGMWYDGSTYLFAVWDDSLYYIDQLGAEIFSDPIYPTVVSYRGYASSATNASSYTFAAFDLGVAAATRRIVVGIPATEWEDANLVTNGTFTTDLSGWTVSGGSWVWQTDANPYAVSIFDSQPLTQTITTVAGATYRIRVVPRASPGVGTIYGRFGTFLFGIFAASDGAQTFEVTAVGTSNDLTFVTSTTSGSIGVDTVTVNRVQTALPTAVTIGGVAATNSVAATRAALWIANVAAGATGNIVLTYANTMNDSGIEVWRMSGVASDTPYDTDNSTAAPPSIMLASPAKGIAIITTQETGDIDWVSGLDGMTQNVNRIVEPGTNIWTLGASAYSPTADVFSPTNHAGTLSSMAGASWTSSIQLGDVTFAKNNKSPTPDQVLVVSGVGAYTFNTTTVASISVNSEITNSVTFGEGFFFFSTPEGLVYASGLNATTVNSLDVMRVESKSEPLIRVLFFNQELYIFSATHIEVRASSGSPNASGFPLNRTTVIWRGLVGIHAVTGWEDGFHANLTWVADDGSVRMLVGYNPQQISTPDLERAIAAVADKTAIRAFCYDVDGHACVVIDIGTATWTYDLNETKWHERKSINIDYWRPTGNSVKAFDKWIVGDHLSGNLYQIDPTSMVDGAEQTISFIAESIEMEAFPQRLQVPRADFNFVTGVGDATTRDPDVFISWSDNGGHTWSDPVTRKLGEAGRYFEQIRLNRVGLTGRKGRRWRVQVDDPVYVGLLKGSMEVSGRP